MSKEILELVPGKIELITTKGEIGYQEVLDNFPSAKFIFVTTYNISEKRDQLNKLLQTYSKTAEVRVVTNIPNRFERYFEPKEKPKYGKTPKEKARDSIENYAKKLDPESYEGLTPFIHLENHSKIVLTENIAYIGSQNFSPESSNSRETGFLVKDPLMVKSIIDSLVPLLEGEGIQYFGENKLNYLRILFSYLLTSLNGALDVIHGELYAFGGYLDEFEYYNTSDPQLTQRSLDGLLGILTDIEEEIENLNSKVSVKLAGIIDPEIINSIRVILEEDSPLDNLANFNRSGYINASISEEISQRMYDDVELEELMEIIQHKGFDRHSELAQIAEGDADQLFKLTEKLKSNILGMIQEISRLEKAQDTINNTN